MNERQLIDQCKELIDAFNKGDLGQTEMPENSHPVFRSKEENLIYFTFPMALNYQRNSYELWKSAVKTWNDPETNDVYSIKKSATMSNKNLQRKLIKYKLALQPNKQTDTWQKIAKTIHESWGSIEKLLTAANFDYLKLKEIIQIEYKKGFPYLSGPKIFNYWCYILTLYCNIPLINTEYIEIAPDTHVTKCSILLGVITEIEANNLSKEEISSRWRRLLKGSGLNPIDMHAPLWFWSRNGFVYKLKN